MIREGFLLPQLGEGVCRLNYCMQVLELQMQLTKVTTTR